jgi:hypothetical protein
MKGKKKKENAYKYNGSSWKVAEYEKMEKGKKK